MIDDPESRGVSRRDLAEAERLERLVGDVLDLAKLDAHRFTVLARGGRHGQAPRQAYAAFGEEARRRGIDYPQDSRRRPVIVSDGDRVLQIISNLLSNAFRWTPDGGRIELSLGGGRLGVRPPWGPGPGIPATEQRADLPPVLLAGRRGTGVGLAIARELAAALGGQHPLRQSRRGGFHRFDLVLPARAAKSLKSLSMAARRRSRRTLAAPPLAALRPEAVVEEPAALRRVLFAAKLGDATRWLEALAAFAAYCLASSAAYLVNDVRDAEHDRATRSSGGGRSPPARCRRVRRSSSPARSRGRVRRVAASLGLWSAALLAGFLALQAAYSAGSSTSC